MCLPTGFTPLCDLLHRFSELLRLMGNKVCGGGLISKTRASASDVPSKVDVAVKKHIKYERVKYNVLCLL